MANTTTELLNKAVNLMVASPAAAPRLATTKWGALWTVMPTETGGGTEVSGGGYARSAGVSPWSSPAGGYTLLTGTVDFPQVTSSWGTIVGWSLMEAATGTAEADFFCFAPLAVPFTPVVGERPYIPADLISVALNDMCGS